MSKSAIPPVKIAVVGCGAVTESFHLPVLAGHDGVRIAALVDPNVARAERLARLYGVAVVHSSADRIDPTIADAALLATPAFLHASGSIDLMNKGLHVLVEKPMALTLADAAQMVSVAEGKRLVLSVGLFRRLLPAIRLFRAALDAGHIGVPTSVSAEVGDAYTWALTTLSGMKRTEAGGGMLVDMGSHVLDLLLYICNATPRLVTYADNAGAGIETDCSIDLMLHRGKNAVPAHVELSRTRTLRNSIVVEGSAGTVEWKFGERMKLLVHTRETFVDTETRQPRPCTIEASWSDEPQQPGYEGFRAQIDDFVHAVRTGAEPQLSGESVLPSVDLIEQCYAARQPLDEPWVVEQLPPAGRPSTKKGRVLVTGASGFIGCRVCERLHFGSDWQVRALIRQPGRAVRLARMPIEFAVGDVEKPDDLARALEGCDAVVHSVVGTSWRQSERVAVNVNGTKKLVEAALKAGVKRFVHLSTIAIYGDPAGGEITEDVALAPRKGWDYAESKHEAEQIVLDGARRGLPVVILRPGVVYGPHNMTIVVRPLRHLVDGRLDLAECGDVPSNTIYVDNLCRGIELALDHPAAVAGGTFVLSDDDGFTWGDYFGFFADRIGAHVNHVPKPEAAATRAAQRGLIARWTAGTRDLVLSSETKALAKRIYASEPWGTPARWAVDTFPGAVRLAKEWLRPDEAFVYRPNPVSSGDTARFTVDPIKARVRTGKAERMLGFAPIVPRQRAMELTLRWAQFARIVPAAAVEPATIA